MINFSPQKQIAISSDRFYCYMGNSPTLSQVNKEYDELAAVAWLIPQLTDLAVFSNCKQVFSEEQIRSCAEIIVAEYSYLKLSELMLFFYQFKRGDYGQFYGSVSPLTVTISLRLFIQERNKNIDNYETEIKEKKEKEERKNAISYQQYLRNKSLTKK